MFDTPHNEKVANAASCAVAPDVMEPERAGESESAPGPSAPEAAANIIPSESEIIVGVEYSDDTGWHALHLLNSLYAISVRPDKGAVVIAEGPGRGRLRNIRIPFKNIFRFEAVEVPIGHNCFTPYEAADQSDEQQPAPKEKPFFPVTVRLIIKHSGKSDFVSIHDIGTTPLPVLIPALSKRLEDRSVNTSINLHSVEDCVSLIKAVKEWVHKVNLRIKAESHSRAIAPSKYASEESRIYRELQGVCAELNPDEPDVKQILVTALVAVNVSIFIYNVINHLRRMVGAARVCSSFPLDLAINDSVNQDRHLTVGDLYESIKTYHEKTGKPEREAFDAIREHVEDWKKRQVIIKSSQDLCFLEENAPRHINIVDPTKKINEKKRILSGLELRHEKQLRAVFDNEAIEVHEFPDLPFLSLLVEYETEGDQPHYAVLIKDGLHQALKEFLLAHEMGHWFLHISSGIAARSEKVELFLRSSARHTFLEDEADNFGMAVLFPPAYLADREILKGELSTEQLLDEFLEGMTAEATPRLKEGMRHYIDDHLKRYKTFKENKAPKFLTIEVKSIKEKDLEGLLALIQEANETFYWVKLDKDSLIVDASDNSVELFGLPKTELIGAPPTDLVVEEEVERMRQRGKYRREHKKAIYYFTEIKNKEKNSSRPVMVYSFPILDDEGAYAGAMAALRNLDEREDESLS